MAADQQNRSGPGIPHRTRRFTAARITRIVGWTSLSIAWTAMLIGRPAPPVEAAPPSATPEATSSSVVPTVGGVPTIPEGGLQIIRPPTMPEATTPTTVPPPPTVASPETPPPAAVAVSPRPPAPVVVIQRTTSGGS